MKDRFGRTIEYMRISVTDRCNLRCRYCMPDDIEKRPMNELLRYEQITELAQAAIKCGITHFRLTGGEPLVRKGVTELVRMLKNLPGTEEVTLTTNGILLPDLAGTLAEAGLDGINISLDTLKPERFTMIAGKDSGLLDRTLEGIEKSVELGLRTKLNCVLQKGVNEEEWKELIQFAHSRPIDVRFIEMMPIGCGIKVEGIGNDELMKQLLAEYPQAVPDERTHGSGPARYIRIPGFTGSIGFISAVHGPFCSTCNRIRLTSTGTLKSCLCYDTGMETSWIFKEGDPEARAALLEDAVRQATLMKPEKHCFSEPEKITEHKLMTQIGG
ncbi:MAG: GTP 3',8-cyclase MoaA [Lachnospiraceae bacterium]|nr:GTP 3',8-cyclase MoaA [Lachnospiraceae bacterium]